MSRAMRADLLFLSTISESSVPIDTSLRRRCRDPGVNGAENASLTIMCGASSSSTFDRAKPVLGMMGKKVIMCGGLGMGLAAKLCNK